jgi:hypothetical protein
MDDVQRSAAVPNSQPTGTPSTSGVDLIRASYHALVDLHLVVGPGLDGPVAEAAAHYAHLAVAARSAGL